MGVVQLRRALQKRVADVTAGGGDGLCQRLVQTSDLVEGLRGAGLTPLSTLDAKKVDDGTIYRESCWSTYRRYVPSRPLNVRFYRARSGAHHK